MVNKSCPKITCAEAQFTIYQTDIKIKVFGVVKNGSKPK